MSDGPGELVSDPNFNPASVPFIEQLYESYLSDPSSVESEWQHYFHSLRNGRGSNGSYVSHNDLKAELVHRARTEPTRRGGPQVDRGEWAAKQAAVLNLINSYRLYGHLEAGIDPLGLMNRPNVPELEPRNHGLLADDMGQMFHTGNMPAPDQLPLHEIMARLKNTYCSSIGVEFMHLTNPEEREFIYEQVEATQCDPDYSAEEKKEILGKLTTAEGLERYLHVKYSGQKRFGLEGCESLIPMMHELIERGGASGVKEFVFGMAHRGRLNMLVNIMGKQPKTLFEEFEGGAILLEDRMTGDVKYHQGYSSDVRTAGGPVHLVMGYNPSHLEVINPVVNGSVRARQDRRNDTERREVVPVLIHGDAAIAGQGIVYETLALSQTAAYGCGGSIHVVVNNQIGFTTSNPHDARSSTYCTDVGKVANCPIFHVNADDPEACVFAMRVAIDFRQRFKRDVFIDLCGYRRYGHNEADLPQATQPMMYGAIVNQATALTQYRERLLAEEVVSEDEADEMAAEYRAALDKGDTVNSDLLPDFNYPFLSNWDSHLTGHWSEPVDTTIDAKTLARLGELITRVPGNIELNPRVKKIMDDRGAMVRGEIPMDWGCAETLAYASLLDCGYPVRLTGQDVCRGTFFHRHAVLHDQKAGETHTPLKHLDPDQSRFTIHDSVLSENAVLGFEYGYSSTVPNALVIWEAQYGDFVNGAQVIIDQFISSSWQKWHLLTGLTMFLPHGWEGQGPEHSSARLERFMQLCALENMQVVEPSTPAQMFHMLRRQMLRKARLPLIVMTPKSMLRKPQSFTTLDDLTEGSFQVVIGEQEKLDPKKVTRVSICAGKVYYALMERRKKEKLKNVAIIRLEQLYPFPYQELEAELAKFPNAKEIWWTQEEPRNQGPWYQIDHRLRRLLQPHQKLRYAGRIPCSAPAGGTKSRHLARANLLIEASLGLRDDKTGEESVRRPRPDYT